MPIYVVPNWFYGYDIAFEVFFALTTLFVAWYAWKIYKLSEQKESKIFATSFLFISLSYFFWAFLNMFVISQIKGGFRELNMSNVLLLGTFLIYANIIFFISGIALLAYTALKTESQITLYMILAIAYAAIILSSNKFMATYVLASVLLLFVIIHYFNEYRKNKNKITEAILLAFVLLFIGNTEFIFAQQNYFNYIICHALELIAYIIILRSLITIVKHGEKKKPARNHP